MGIISSKDNKYIKYIKNLLSKSNTREKERSFVVEGIKLVNEALEYAEVLDVVCAESLYNEVNSETFSRALLKDNPLLTSRIKTKALIVTDSIFKSISETITPQGVLAVVKMPSYTINSDFLEKAYKKTGYLKLLILENIKDPGNIGTMIRTGEAAGITAIIINKGSADIFNPKVVRSTMGSIFRVPFIYVDDLKKEIKELKKHNIRLYATHLKGENGYKDIKYSNKAGILIGNEARGLSDEITALSDVYVKIPMHGRVESLNASIAAALIMYEVG